MAVDLSKLSTSELEAIASGNMASLSDETLRMLAAEATPATAPAPSLPGLALRSAVIGLSSPTNIVADFVSGAYNLGAGLLGSERRLPYISREQKDALTRIGFPPAQTTGQKLFSATMEGITSPQNYLFPLSSATQNLPRMAQGPFAVLEQGAVAAGAEAGGMAGEYVGEKVGAPMTGRVIGGLFGGGSAAYGAGTTVRTAPLVGKAFDLAKGQWEKVRGTVPEDELLKDVDNRISNIFIAAGAADPNFMKTIIDAAKAQERISLKSPGGAQVSMPMSALLANNPVIDSFVQNLSSRDPVFRAQYGAQYESAKQALTQNQIRLFGDPSKVTVKAAAPDFSKTQAMLVKSLDEKIADAYKGQSIDPNAFGKRVSDLIAEKEKSAYAEVKPLYTEAFNIAKSKNLQLPSSSVNDIYNFVQSERLGDIFATFPTIYRKVSDRFKPVTMEPSPILTAEGAPMRPGGVSFNPATIEDLDSLKREINKQLGKTSQPSEIRVLSELKDRVSGHIDSLDPDFVAAYRNADKAYFQKVGLPFDSATLSAIDRKKFDEQIAPALIGNKSNVSDFISATGDQGVKLVRDAFLDAFSTAALKNGALDPKAAEKWLRKNEGGVSLVPGLRDELDAASRNVQVLIDKRNQLNADFQRVAGEQILSKEGVSGPQELVSKMYGDINFTNRFMTQYRTDKDSVSAVRAFMLDDIVRSGDPIAMLSDRNRAAIFNRVFGPKYSQEVRDFATAANRLTRDITQVSFRGETVPKTPVEQLTGVPLEQIISRIYNPVSGATYAMTSLFSKYWAKQASAATEEKLKQLLLNPADAVKVFRAVQPSRQGVDTQKIRDAVEIGRKYGIDWVNDAVNDLMSGAARGTVQQSQEQ